tara:strand:- start:212 stop:493 length:282 start_codon:yes stop_codon:yes gene_type:complete
MAKMPKLKTRGNSKEYAAKLELVEGDTWFVEGSRSVQCGWEFEITPDIKESILEEYGGDVAAWVDEHHDEYNVSDEEDPYTDYDWELIRPGSW